MDDWDDYVAEQYEEYMAENCTCASSDEECPCMSFKQFVTHEMKRLEEFWQNYYADQEEECCEVMECKM